MKKCPICGNEARIRSCESRDASLVDCPRCGEFSISGLTEASLSLSDRQKANISGWLLDNQNYEISDTNVGSLLGLNSPSFTERADRLLLYVSSQTEYAGQMVDCNQKWISKTWCINEEELKAFTKYLDEIERLKKHIENKKYSIIPQGWLRLEELKKVNIESNQGFVAMWFHQDMKSIYDEIISKAILDAGYYPHRVDQREHNDKIDDEIISQIRQSKFVIADFTGHRGGVYYEAGFAKRLGLEVFWLCREDELEQLHFDIRQYNCITWDSAKKDELKSRLKNRIESVLGHGTFKE